MSFGIPVRNGVMLGLTASTALTARGGFPVPTLALNFLSGALDSRVSLTRALNTATRFNSSGLIELVNADLPRFDYNPSTLAPKGLLVEESRANLLLYSDQFNSATWSKTASVNPDQLVSPDGTTNADLVSTTGNFQYVRQLITATANAAYTVSFFVKPVSGTPTVRLYLTNGPQTEVAGSNFSLVGAGSLGTLFQIGTGVVTSRTITQLANGWYRCTVSGTVNTTSLYGYIDNHSVGTVSYGLYGAQLEAGAFATSYIPTTTASLTRNADVASMTGTNFSSWFNQTEGTFVVDGVTSSRTTAAATAEHVLEASSTLRMVRGASSVALGWNIGSTTFSSFGVTTANLRFKSAAAYKAASNAASLNASAPLTDAGSTYGSPTSLGIGCNTGGAQQFNGHIRALTYFNTRLPNGNLQTLSQV